MKSLVVYTTLLGNYDFLREPEVVDADCDYICLTDDMSLDTKVWKLIDVSGDKGRLPLNKWNRMYKVLAHRYFSDYEASVYIDSNVRLTGSLREYISQYPDSKIVCLRHPQRDCIYEEAEACIACGKDSTEKIRQQVQAYRENGYPEHNGLIVSNVLYRIHNDPDVVRTMEFWWNEILNNSCRDQLCFNYACWKCGLAYSESDLLPWKSMYWKNSGAHFTTLDKAEDEIVNLTLAYVSIEKALNKMSIEKDTHIRNIEAMLNRSEAKQKHISLELTLTQEQYGIELDKLAETKKALQQTQEMKEELEVKLAQVERQLELICASRSYRLMEKFEKIKNALGRHS